MKKDEKQTGATFIDCPNWGKGGNYVINPVTGLRELAPAEESTPGEVIAQGSETKKVTSKEKVSG